MINSKIQTKLNKEVGRVTAFTFVFWVDSSDQEKINLLFLFLDSLKVPSCVSPLHDQDIDSVDVNTGEIIYKKSHFHVVVDFGSGNNKTINQCFELIDPIRSFISIAPFDSLDLDDSDFQKKYDSAVKVWKFDNMVRNMRTLLRYFKHLDNPEKHQYFDLDYHVFCGFELDDRILNQCDSLRVLDDILDFVENNEVYCFWDLLTYCRKNNREWYSVLAKPQINNLVINAIKSYTFSHTGALDRKIEKYEETN